MSYDGVNDILVGGNISTIYKNGDNIGTSGTGSNGDQIYFGMISSSNYLTPISGNVSIGTATAIWTIITMEQPDTDPNPFIIDPIT